MKSEGVAKTTLTVNANLDSEGLVTHSGRVKYKRGGRGVRRFRYHGESTPLENGVTHHDYLY